MIDTLSVEEAIALCLEHHNYNDAVFAAEAFAAQVECDDAWYLLATAYYRMGRLRAAYELLQQRAPQSAKAILLAAQCACNLQLYAEAELLLCDPTSNAQQQPDQIDIQFGKSAAFAHLLLAKIYTRTFRTDLAVASAKRALQLNPILWSAVEIICKNESNEESINLHQLWQQRKGRSPKHKIHDTFNHFSPATPDTQFVAPASVKEECSETPVTATAVTPVLQQNLLKSTSTSNAAAPAAPRKGSQNARVSRAVSVNSADGQQQTQQQQGQASRHTRRQAVFSQNRQLQPANNSQQQQQQQLPPTRKSQRIIHTSIKENAKSSTPSSDCDQKPNRQSGRRSRMHQLNEQNSLHDDRLPQNEPLLIEQMADDVEKDKDNSKSGSRTCSRQLQQPQQQQHTQLHCNTIDYTHRPATLTVTFDQRTSLNALYPLMSALFELHTALSTYNAGRMLQIADALDTHVRQTLPVQLCVARAHFENADYKQAVNVYREIHSAHPYNVLGFEYHSTALWHLQQEHELSALAQELTKRDPTTPQAWCVAGNCFSLHKEHEIATKFFERAIQCDEWFAYAYTLLGHEYMATDNTDKAMQSFRNALQLSPKHYNAWFGLSLVYYRQQQMPLAYRHLCRALECNRFNTVIQCHLAVVLSALNQPTTALKLLDDAIKRAPNNVMCKYHRSQLLYAKGDCHEALEQLAECKRLAPKEPMVYFLTGTVHKRLGNSHLALMNLSWATELDPRGEHSSALGAGARYEGEPSPDESGLDSETTAVPDTDISIVDD